MREPRGDDHFSDLKKNALTKNHPPRTYWRRRGVWTTRAP